MERTWHKAGCLVCGKPLVYLQEHKQVQCFICGETSMENVCCEDGHYICDACHAKESIELITGIALATKHADPIKIAIEMMNAPLVYMHGPEHHYLIAAALLAAYAKTVQKAELPALLAIAKERSAKIPGGICGMWGSCGAGIGAGLFVSVITSCTPLSQIEWGLANQATANSLQQIGRLGGPRCCKRNVFTSIIQTVEFVNAQLEIHMACKKPICGFFDKNEDCIQNKCPYHPNI